MPYQPRPSQAGARPEQTLAELTPVPSAATKDDPSALPPQVCPLTEEEQLALYEQSLKESDWGHQPC